LGLTQIVLKDNASKDEDLPEKALSKEDMEIILKNGCYALLKDQEETKFDLDLILENAKTIEYGKDKQEDQSTSNFSKAVFVANQDEENVDIDDKDYWNNFFLLNSKDMEKKKITPRKRKQESDEPEHFGQAPKKKKINFDDSSKKNREIFFEQISIFKIERCIFSIWIWKI